MTTLAHEATTVQFPLVRYAAATGWTVISDVDALIKRRGEGGLFFYVELEAALLRLNPGVVGAENVAGIIQRMEAVPNTIAGNREILEWLRGQRTIYHTQEKRHRNVTLIDFDHLDRNIFQVTYEWAYRNGPRKGNRADIMFLINGVPVAIVENKNPKKKDAMEIALRQLLRYELETPEMMTAPQVFNITHLIEYFYGVTWNYQRKFIFNWKEERPGSYQERVRAFFDCSRFLRMLKDWILFYVKDDELWKTCLRQHQTRAAVKVVDRCRDDRKNTGLVWHTQGSGKTFTMITAARLILEDKTRFPGATVILVVDRNELEGQLSGWVEAILGEMQQLDVKVEVVTSKKRLQELLDQDFRGLIVTMIHKFDGIRKDSCTRRDFFVLIDEAHRSTGGDLGNYLMGALPKATLIGFTGTPIDKTAYGKGTFKIFGKEDEQGYLDKYSIAESIADGTTVILRHTLAPVKIRLPKEILEQEFLSLTEAEGVSDIEELNRILERAVHLRAFLKSDERVDAVARFVAEHFENNVEPLGYKAFLVAVDREACALYKKALDKYLPPDVAVPVYTRSATDTIDHPQVAQLQLDETGEKNTRKLFTRPDKKPQILIVTDKLLTGYDAPILYCMYLDKPMRDHVLLQAIARVNRPYEDDMGNRKPCGLIVDFVGILRELNKALAFDSDEVSGVIEDLDILMNHFLELMRGPAQAYLVPGKGTKDQQLEALLYETFLDKDKRQSFIDLYKDIEGLYEILSPSPELRDFIDDYRRLADLYLMLHNAYGGKTVFHSDVARKTEFLIRETAEIYGPVPTGRAVEFDEAALQALKKRPGPDAEKILNLVRALRATAEEQGQQQPYLIGISERAEAVMEALDERKLTTEKALEQLEALMRERLDTGREREELDMNMAEYTLFRTLHEAEIPDSETLARTIATAFLRYPNHLEHDDERRQLKAEIYKVLLQKVSGCDMVDLVETMLRQAIV
ncbi:MAG: HsdR family type I site-specific deoxyribonuclease [Gammaproteobacteria bacterium]|nr:HsdR family type I site-specific deoxyribonuclease [Gammaproteobacteria bacterium]